MDKTCRKAYFIGVKTQLNSADQYRIKCFIFCRPKKRAEVEVPDSYEEICIISSSNEKTIEFDKKGPLDFNKRNEG